jgi:hypothetical protein
MLSSPFLIRSLLSAPADHDRDRSPHHRQVCLGQAKKTRRSDRIREITAERDAHVFDRLFIALMHLGEAGDARIPTRHCRNGPCPLPSNRIAGAICSANSGTAPPQNALNSSLVRTLRATDRRNFRRN